MTNPPTHAECDAALDTICQQQNHPAHATIRAYIAHLEAEVEKWKDRFTTTDKVTGQLLDERMEYRTRYNRGRNPEDHI